MLPPKQKSLKCGQEHVMKKMVIFVHYLPVAVLSRQGDASSLMKATGVPRRLMPRPRPPPATTSAQIGSESDTLLFCHRARQDLQSAGRAGGQSRAGRKAHPEQMRLHLVAVGQTETSSCSRAHHTVDPRAKQGPGWACWQAKLLFITFSGSQIQV